MGTLVRHGNKGQVTGSHVDEDPRLVREEAVSQLHGEGWEVLDILNLVQHLPARPQLCACLPDLEKGRLD